MPMTEETIAVILDDITEVYKHICNVLINKSSQGDIVAY